MTRRSSGDEVEAARVRKPVVTDYGPLFSSEPAPEHPTPDITPSRDSTDTAQGALGF